MTLWSWQISDASGNIQAEAPPANASTSTLLFISVLLGSLVDPCSIGSKWTYWVGGKLKIEIRKLWEDTGSRPYPAMHKGRAWSRNRFRRAWGDSKLAHPWHSTEQLKGVSCRKWSSSQRACGCLPICTHTHTQKSIVMQLILQKLTKDFIKEIWCNQLFSYIIMFDLDQSVQIVDNQPRENTYNFWGSSVRAPCLYCDSTASKASYRKIMENR